MNNTTKHIPGLIVLFLQIALNSLGKRLISRSIPLYDISRSFVNDNGMVVFVEDL